MDEKLKKALKALKQGVWVMLILAIIACAINIYTLSKEGGNVFLNCLKELAFSFVQIAVFITGLVLLNKEKYLKGAQVIQWSGLGSIIISFATVIASYVIMNEYGATIVSSALPYFLTGLIFPIILIIDSLKVIRLVETEEKQKSIVPLVAIILIVCVIIYNIFVLIQTKKVMDEVMDGVEDFVEDFVEDLLPNETPDKGGSQSTDNNNEENKENNQQSEKEPVKFDPYANYKNMTWSDSSVETRSGYKVTIKDNVLYLNNKKILTNLKAKKVEVYYQPVAVGDEGGIPILNILTTDGKVYDCTLAYLNSDFSNITAKQIVKQYNIIDMTYINNYTGHYIYYLTSDGKLIDLNGVAYNKYNFTGRILGRPVDKYNYGYHYDEKTNSYLVLKNKANNVNLTMETIYVNLAGDWIIITEGKRLFIYNGTSNLVNMEGTVKTVYKQVNGSETNIVVLFTDGKTKTYENITEGYGVKTKQQFNLSTLPTYVDPYANYSQMKWATNKSGVAEIKNNKLYVSNKEVNTGASGTLKSVGTCSYDGVYVVYLLTQEGKARFLATDDITTFNITNEQEILPNEKIIDMTVVEFNTTEGVIAWAYFLTQDGRLIDMDGEKYDPNAIQEKIDEWKDLINKANNAVLSSNEADLKAVVALEYMEQYVAYMEGNASAPNAQSVAAAKRVAEALKIANDNNQGIKYEIIDVDKSVMVQKKDKNGNIIN